MRMRAGLNSGYLNARQQINQIERGEFDLSRGQDRWQYEQDTRLAPEEVQADQRTAIQIRNEAARNAKWRNDSLLTPEEEQQRQRVANQNMALTRDYNRHRNDSLLPPGEIKEQQRLRNQQITSRFQYEQDTRPDASKVNAYNNRKLSHANMEIDENEAKANADRFTPAGVELVDAITRGDENTIKSAASKWATSKGVRFNSYSIDPQTNEIHIDYTGMDGSQRRSISPLTVKYLMMKGKQENVRKANMNVSVNQKAEQLYTKRMASFDRNEDRIYSRYQKSLDLAYQEYNDLKSSGADKEQLVIAKDNIANIEARRDKELTKIKSRRNRTHNRRVTRMLSREQKATANKEWSAYKALKGKRVLSDKEKLALQSAVSSLQDLGFEID